MPIRVLDTSCVIAWWHRHRAVCREPSDLKQLAADLLELHAASGVIWPVRLEFLVGVRSSDELSRARVYLEAFPLLDADRGMTTKHWEEAQRSASRVPTDGKPRDAMDCVIRAIANAANMDVESADHRFPAR